MTATELLAAITAKYLGSRQFNGFPLRDLASDEVPLLATLVGDGLCSIVFGDVHPNPHIRALPDEPVERQLEKLRSRSVADACAYPTAKHLETVIDPSDFVTRPYALALALGGAQLSHRAFDLHVLEAYRNDPRYWYQCDDIVGQVSPKDEGGLRQSDEALIRFGFAYDEDGGRYVAAFLWDLFKLPPEQQQIWKAREVAGKTLLHPDYYRTQIIGDWPERISIYDAFLEELRVINAMANAMGRPPLFRNTYRDNRPKGFASLLRPTLREFNDFVRLLDSMLSDNIDKKFFGSDVSLETEQTRSDGKVIVQQKGTLRLLRDWLEKSFRPGDPKPVEEMHATFGRVRQLRNKPSHSVQEDEFSKEIVQQQRELMIGAYSALRTLRLILANHPAARLIEIDEHVREGLIWTP